MEGDLRAVLKRAILAEGAGAIGGGPIAGKMKKVKKAKKAKGGISPLSVFGPAAESHKLQSLVKQMINEEIKSQGGRMKKAPKKKKGGFHGIHPIEYESDEEIIPMCSCHGCAIHGSGAIGGAMKPKRKLSPHLFPHNAAIKALKGIRFNSKEERQAVINHLASMYNHMATRPQNVKFMKEYIAQHID